MTAVVRGQAAEIGHAEVMEVLLGQQHPRALVVDVQEVLQPREAIGVADRLDAVEGQGNAVAARQLEHLLGLQAALDVDVQFRLGQAGDEGV